MYSQDDIINRIKFKSGLATFVDSEEGQAMLNRFLKCYERGRLMEPERVLKLLVQEFHRQDPLCCWEEQRAISYALRRWVTVMMASVSEQFSGMSYREIADLEPSSDNERLCVETAKFLVGEKYENMGFEVSFKCACTMLDKIDAETADALCVAVADGLSDEVDEFGLTPDDWDAVEHLRESYERFLQDHVPDVDVEVAIGEVDFNLHPSIIIHRCKGYNRMATFHFGLERGDKTITGYILAFTKT